VARPEPERALLIAPLKPLAADCEDHEILPPLTLSAKAVLVSSAVLARRVRVMVTFLDQGAPGRLARSL
jgi:hypothetical protein